MTIGDDLIIQINSDVDLVGIQLSIIFDTEVDIELKGNSHIMQDSHYQDGITRYLAYSMFNQPFNSGTMEIIIESAGHLQMDNIEITAADINGDAIFLSHSQSGQNVQSGSHRFEIT